MLADASALNGHVREQVELILPAEPAMVRLARLVASGIAAAGGFDVEQVHDVRIGVDELCSALLEAGRGEPLRLSFRRDAGSLEVEGSTASGAGEVDPDRFELSRQILAVVVTEHRVDFGGDDLVFWLRKVRDEA